MKGPDTAIVLANDKALYNFRYRNYLLVELEKIYGDRVVSLGTMESGGAFRLLRFAMLRIPMVSSNLKSNILALLVFSRGILILNGLGRYQKSLAFRRLLICGVVLNRSRKQFFVQRYRDYRWLRRFGRGVQVEWMPGSGGETLPTTDSDSLGTYVLISRKEKLIVIEKQLRSAVKKLSIKKLFIYGVESDYQFDTQPVCDVIFMGYVDPREFFLQCKNFLQIDGYGEGFPHTLAYALSSNVNVVIEKGLATSLGLHRLPVKRELKMKGYLAVEPNPEVVSKLSSTEVYKRILEQVARLVNNKVN